MVGCSTPSTTVSNALCRIAHGRGVAVGVALNAGFGVTVAVDVFVALGEGVALNDTFGVIVAVDVPPAVEVGEAVALNAGFGVTVDVLLAVELGEAVTLNAAFGVIVNVDVGVFEKVAVGVAVGAMTVRFNCWVAGAVSAAPAALVNERFVNSMFDVPTTKPLNERVSTWTVPVWPLELLVVRLTR